VPKTAGIAVYCAFVESGWKISNVTVRCDAHSAFSLLKRRYGVSHIPKVGITFGYKHSLQHAPAFLWRLWGDVDDSFAIVRDPLDRFISSMRYRYKYSSHGFKSLDAYIENVLCDVKRHPFHIYTRYAGHLIPQHWFLSDKTFVCRYEDEWQVALVNRYGLNVDVFRKENVSEKYSAAISSELLGWVEKVYRYDREVIERLNVP